MANTVNRKGILSGGNFIVDTVKMIDAWPQQDTLCSILSHSRCNGGGPYNILKNLAKLAPDLPLEACGLLGDDPESTWVLDDCKQAGICTSQLNSRAGPSTSVTDAMTDVSTGRRTFFHARGANAELSVEDFDFRNTSAKIFSLGYLMLLDQLDQLDEDGNTGASTVLKNARAEGLITAVDVVSTAHPQFREISIAALKKADIFFINELEAGWILGYEISESNIRTAIRELAQLGSIGTVVLHMPQLAVAYTISSDTLTTQASVNFPAEKIVGATGAGDAFATGFLYATHEGLSVQKSLESAVCVAAMSLTHATPSDGILSLSECLALGKRYGYRQAEKF